MTLGPGVNTMRIILISIRKNKRGIMHADLQTPTLVVVSINPHMPPRVSSTQLLRGQRTVGIEHGNQHYTLRVTRDNKLILTK